MFNTSHAMPHNGIAMLHNHDGIAIIYNCLEMHKNGRAMLYNGKAMFRNYLTMLHNEGGVEIYNIVVYTQCLNGFNYIIAYNPPSVFFQFFICMNMRKHA